MNYLDLVLCDLSAVLGILIVTVIYFGQINVYNDDDDN